jgi:hypothetical protein
LCSKAFTSRYKGENFEAPISPGIYEVRYTATGALHSFGAVDNAAQALSRLPLAPDHGSGGATRPDQFRTCATSTKAAAERMVGRRDTYLSGAA